MALPVFASRGGADGVKVAHTAKDGRLSFTPFVIATVSVAAWVVFFALGAIINSQPYRDLLNAASVHTESAPAAVPATGDATGAPAATMPPSPPADPGAQLARTKKNIGELFSFATLFALLVVVITFTPPNLAILSSLAAVVGAAGRWMTDGEYVETGRPAEEKNAGSGGLRTWASGVLVGALMRGFFVYLAILSGLLVLISEPFENPSPGQYVRLAGTCSLFCFIVGWQPGILAGLINRFMAAAKIEDSKAGTKTTNTVRMVEASVTVEPKMGTPAVAPDLNGATVAKP
jgi:hypothetical protein